MNAQTSMRNKPSMSRKSLTICGGCLCAKYLTNFSVFRSVPDHWALDQLFPIVPIHWLNKPPTEYATLCDITCDSDGVVDKFVDLHDVKQVLELHSLVPGETYYLAFLLVGAYQEVMGNNHNLFGAPHEAHIYIDEEGYLIKKVIRGTTVGEATERARYERSLLARRVSPFDYPTRQRRRTKRSRRRGTGSILRVALRRLHISFRKWCEPSHATQNRLLRVSNALRDALS